MNVNVYLPCRKKVLGKNKNIRRFENINFGLLESKLINYLIQNKLIKFIYQQMTKKL